MEEEGCEMSPKPGSEKQRKMTAPERGHCNGAEGVFQLNDRGCRKQAEESAHGYEQLGPSDSCQTGT